MARKETRLPSLRTVEDIKEALDVRLGRRGDKLDKAVTFRDLIESGSFSLRGRGLGGGDLDLILPPPGSVEDGVDLGTWVPQAPVGLRAIGLFGGIGITWDWPDHITSIGFAEIYRSDVNDAETRQLITVEGGTSYFDVIDAADQTEYFYWVRFRSRGDIVGPFAGPASATVMPLVEEIIERITGEIDAGVLAQSLREEIEKIDIHDTRFGEVEDRLDDERERLDGRIDEARDNAEAISNRLDVERDRLDGRVDDALQNVDQVDARVDDTRSRLDDRVDELRGEIVDVDTSAADRVAEERDARLAALDEEATARGSEIDAERVARVAAIQAEAEEREERFLQWETDYELDRGLYAAQLTAIAAAYETSAATIYSLEEVRITDREATATRIDGMEVRLDDNEASITQEQTVRANAVSSLASQISVLSAKIDALPTFANGFEAGLEFDRWVAADGHAIEAEDGDAFAGDQSALISSTASSVDTSEAPFAVSSRIPSGTADAFVARRLRVSLAGRQVEGGSGEFAVGYAIADQWFSGWTMFAPEAGWTIFEATVEVPDEAVGDHYVVIWGDTSGGGGAVEVDRLLVDVADSEIPEITAQIDALQQVIADNEQAMAQELTQLESQFGDSLASLDQDIQTVSDATSALGQQITTVDARVDTSRALIQDESQSRADADSALASDIQTLTATTGDLAADIQNESQARADADEALASDITDLWAGVGENEARITDEASTRATEDELLAGIQRVISASKGASSATTVSLEEVRLEEGRVIATRFNAIEGEVGETKGAITDIENLTLSSDSALVTRFSEVEGRVGDSEGAITRIEDLDLSPDSALITRFSEVEGRIGETEGAITNIESLNLSPGSALITRFNSVEGEVESAQGSIKSIEDLTLSSGSALIGRFEALEGSVGDAQGAINDIRDLNISDDSALATRLSGLEASIDNVEAGASQQLTSEVERIDGDINAVSQAVTQVQADTGDEFAAVRQELSTEINGVTGEINALWNVRVTGTSADGEQVLGGIGLGTEGDTVDVVFDVDRVAFGRTNEQGRKPFIIDGGTVYLDEVMIRQGAIQEGQLGAISVGKLQSDGTPVTDVFGLLNADDIDVDNLRVAEAARFVGRTQSENYSPGSRGWMLDPIQGTGQINFPISFSNVSGREALTGGNYIINGNFTTGDFFGWGGSSEWFITARDPSGGGNAQRTMPAPYAARIDTVSGTRQLNTDLIPCAPGQTLEVSLDVATLGSGGDIDFEFIVRFHDGSGDYLSLTSVERPSLGSVSWSTLTGTVEVPEDAGYFHFSLRRRPDGSAKGLVVTNARASVVPAAIAPAATWVKPDTTLIDGNRIATGEAYVDTLEIRGNAVTIPEAAYTPGAESVGNSWTPVQWLTVTRESGPLALTFGVVFACSLTSTTDSGDNPSTSQGRVRYRMRILQNGNAVWTDTAAVFIGPAPPRGAGSASRTMSVTVFYGFERTPATGVETDFVLEVRAEDFVGLSNSQVRRRYLASLEART